MAHPVETRKLSALFFNWNFESEVTTQKVVTTWLRTILQGGGLGSLKTFSGI
jgi:hypothetical protein